MKGFMKKSVSQKIISLMIILILFNFTVPINSYGIGVGDIASSIAKEFIDFIAWIGDVAMGALNHFMLGTSQIVGSSLLDLDDKNIIDESYESYLCPKVQSQDGIKFEDVYEDIKSNVEFDGLVVKGTQIPNFLYCPENIFANRIAALDINFLKPHTYTQVEYGDEEEKSKEKATSAATVLANTISSWYKIFRRIAIVGLLSVLVYLGIRIMISSTAVDKAKYKETFNDWLIALVLVVVIHYIMAGILMFTDNVTQLINKSNKTIVVRFFDESGAEVNGDGGEIPSFRTNLIGFVRFRAQSTDFGDATAYTIIYMALVIFTCMFTVTYLKRFFFMAFFTMIAPLVALTYPLDKLRDGKAQAFDMWLKEFTMNVIIQPVHLILYTVLVSSAMDLALNNPLYACVAMLSLLPAEKFIKKMFGLDRAQTTSGLGEIAGGALAMQGIKMIGNAVKGKNKSADGKDGNSSLTDGDDSNVSSIGLRQSLLNGGGPKGGSSGGQSGKQTGGQTGKQTGGQNVGKNKRRHQKNGKKRKISKRKSTKKKLSQSNGNNNVNSIKNHNGNNKANVKPKIKNSPGTWKDGLKEIAKDKTRRLKNKATDPFRKGNRGKTAKKVFKTAGKVAGMGLGAVAGGVLAGAAGIASGDLSKAVSYTAGGLALGAGIGSGAGGKAADFVNDEVSSSYDIMERVTKTDDEIKAKKEEIEMENFRRDENNIAKLRKKGLNSDQINRFMDKAENLHKLGETDIDVLSKIIEMQYGGDLKNLNDNSEFSDDYAMALSQGYHNTSAKLTAGERDDMRKEYKAEGVKDVDIDIYMDYLSKLKGLKK